MNLYKGDLLKDPPLDKLDADVQFIIQHNHFLPGLCINYFSNCCGIRVLGTFEGYPSIFHPDYPGNVSFRPSITNKAALSAAIWKIKDIIDKELRLKKVYLVVTLNGDEMKTGIHHILMDYFGFKRLEDDFINLQPSDKPFGPAKRSHIAVFGLCTTKFYSRNM